jgi:hypothetical protein
MTFTTSVDYIRTTFFPGWDKGRRWQVVQVADLDGAQGRCERKIKTISVLGGIERDDLLALLIHEIAHAISNDFHGKRWLQRMEKAASHADQQGLPTLAALLRQQIVGYQDGFRMTAAMMYGEIENCVVSEPQVTFPQVVDFLRRDWGVNRNQFLRRFRRAERVFEEAQRNVRESAEAKAKWLDQQSPEAGLLNTPAPLPQTPAKHSRINCNQSK